MPDPTYRVIRYVLYGENKVIATGLTLEQAQSHCSSPCTQGDGWFDGYVREN